MENVQIPLKAWKKIERVLDKIDKEHDEFIDEEAACKLLGLKKVTIINKVSNKTIPPSFYKTSPVTGKRFYNKQKLMGL